MRWTPMRAAGAAALLLCGLASLGFGAALPGQHWLQHPLALPGAAGLPHAPAFNLLGLILPGGLAAVAAAGLLARAAVAGRAARVGQHMLLLSGLAFAAQGLFPLALDDLQGAASRLHATCWLLWWIAAGTGLALAGGGLDGRQRLAAWVAALVVIGAVLPLGVPGLRQRLACLAWLGWLAWASARAPARTGG